MTALIVHSSERAADDPHVKARQHWFTVEHYQMIWGDHLQRHETKEMEFNMLTVQIGVREAGTKQLVTRRRGQADVASATAR